MEMNEDKVKVAVRHTVIYDLVTNYKRTTFISSYMKVETLVTIHYITICTRRSFILIEYSCHIFLLFELLSSIAYGKLLF